MSCRNASSCSTNVCWCVRHRVWALWECGGGGWGVMMLLCACVFYQCVAMVPQTAGQTDLEEAGHIAPLPLVDVALHLHMVHGRMNNRVKYPRGGAAALHGSMFHLLHPNNNNDDDGDDGISVGATTCPFGGPPPHHNTRSSSSPSPNRMNDPIIPDIFRHPPTTTHTQPPLTPSKYPPPEPNERPNHPDIYDNNPRSPRPSTPRGLGCARWRPSSSSRPAARRPSPSAVHCLFLIGEGFEVRGICQEVKSAIQSCARARAVEM